MQTPVTHIPDGKLTRRQLLGRGAGLGLGLAAGPSLLAACGGGDGGGGGGGGGEEVALTFVSYGGAYQEAQTKAWLDPYMKENPNVRIVQDEPTDYAKIKAMVEAGNVTWDVVDVGNDFGLDIHADLLEPIDCSVVPCDEFSEEFKGKYRIADIIYGVVYAYRTDKVGGKKPQDWADFFDLDTFPGKRGLWKFASGGVFEFALVADGVDAKNLYPLDVDRALKKLDTIKDSIVWWDTGAQSAQLLADGEVTLGHSWNGRIYDVAQQGSPVEVQWNQHFQTADFLVLPKGGKNIEEGMKLIAYITSAENNARLSKYIPYAPPNEKAVGKADPSKKKDLPTTHNDVALFFDDQWWGENFAEVDKQFQSWLQA